MALISVVKSEIVEKKGLIEDEVIMDGVALAMLLPGPVAVNVVAYVGHKMRGAIGAAVCVVAVIVPSFVLMLTFASLYLSWGELTVANKALSGVLPAIAAIILNAALKMRKNALRDPLDFLIAAIAACLLLGVGGIWVVVFIFLGAATLGILRHREPQAVDTENDVNVEKSRLLGLSSMIAVFFLVLCLALFLFSPQINSRAIILQLFSVFSGMSLLLFGGGYIFIPMIQETVVNSQGWLTIDEFTASIALGQVTPGPILISATFIGYKIAGIAGAVVATISIFVPPAVLIIFVTNQLDRFNHMTRFKMAQSGIRVAVFGMIISAALTLLIGMYISQSSEKFIISIAIFILACIGLAYLKKDEIWIILISAIIGILIL